MKGAKQDLAEALLLVGVVLMVSAVSATAAETNPCQGSIDRLLTTYEQDAAFRALADRALANVQRLPGEGAPNPWSGKDIHYMADFFARWCSFLPSIDGSHDDGLKYIQKFAQFYYRTRLFRRRYG
jgi:hypothetical protein